MKDTRQYVVSFIKTLSPSEKEGMRIMTRHGILCGIGYAKANGIDPVLFNEELMAVLGGE